MNAGDFLGLLQNPQGAAGGEINSCRREFRRDDINVCLLFPETYAIGMSHAGLKILYHLLNAIAGVHAQRAFLPEPENVALYRGRTMPLFSVENRTPLAEFDLIGVSLLSELNFTNVLLALDLAGLPLRACERGSSQPLVAAGGIAAANPEPLRDFVDLFAFGDGEVLFPEIIEVLKRGRRQRAGRAALLEELSGLAGIYVPGRQPLRRRGPFLVPDLGGRRIAKRVLADLDGFPSQAAEIVPVCDVVFNRLNVEIARGCPQNCRFCQAKSYYAPFRARDPRGVLDFIGRALAATGYESFSLASLSSGDYPGLDELLRRIPAAIQPDVSFSVPSLRPATLSEELLATLALFRKTGITIVPEAGSERLRRAINKNVSDDEIFRALETAWKHGWQKVKMYFMIGLPQERDEDIEAIALLLENILASARQRRARIAIHASFSSFVPKPHTPLQWAPRAPLTELEEKIARLRSRLQRHRNLDLDFHSPGRSMIETVLARGDARVGELLLAAFRRNETFSAWDAHFHLAAWQQELPALAGADFLSEIPLEAELPWDFIDLNYRRAHLEEEYRLSRSGQATPACAQRDCGECAGCRFGQRESPPVVWPQEPAPAAPPPASYRRLRLTYEKKGDMRLWSHLAMMQYLERLLRQSGLLFKYSGGFHPRMRLVSLPPLPVGAEGDAEVIEVHVAGDLPAQAILERLNRLQPGFAFCAAAWINGDSSLHKRLRRVSYRFAWPPAARRPEREEIASLLAPGDSLDYGPAAVELRMDFARQGAERFARVYRLLDPQRRWTSRLRRTEVMIDDPD